jgi:micrococcal nuclease
MLRLVFFYIICSFYNTVHAYNGVCVHDRQSLRCIEYVRNYDGDTITVNIPGFHSIVGDHMKIRLLGIDTPEIRSSSKCEREAAKLAKNLVQDILSKAKYIEIRNFIRGKYFRIIGDVYADGENIASAIKNKGLALKYDGGKKIDFDWCSIF